MKILEIIADIFVDEDPYHGDVDLVKLLNMADCDQHRAYDVTTGPGMTAAGSKDFLKHRVTEIKVYARLFFFSCINCIMHDCNQNGAPVVLDIFRYHGRLKRKQDWRRQMFQIKDGVLKYFKSNPVR